MSRLRPGARWAQSTVVTERDRDEFDSFASAYLHAIQGPAGSEWVWLTTQAYDDPALEKCPALTTDNLCGLQLNHKPLGCQTVPLDPLLPDRLQFPMLTQRAAEAAYMGADCITLGPSKRAPLLVAGQQVADEAARLALEGRRNALKTERSLWGDAVFGILRSELFEHPEQAARLPVDGYLALSLAPVLATLSVASSRVRRRVTEYLSAQIDLLAEAIGSPPSVMSPRERTLTGFFRANVAMRGQLQQFRGDGRESEDAQQIEEWLGLRGDHTEASGPGQSAAS